MSIVLAPRIVFELQGSTTTQLSHLGNKIEGNPSDASTCKAKQARMWCIGRDQIVSPQQLPLTESSSWRIIIEQAEREF
jgi:hypothetical protein